MSISSGKSAFILEQVKREIFSCGIKKFISSRIWMATPVLSVFLSYPPTTKVWALPGPWMQAHRVGVQGQFWYEEMLQSAMLTPDPRSVSITCPWSSPKLNPSYTWWHGMHANSTHTKMMFTYTLNPVEVFFSIWIQNIVQCHCNINIELILLLILVLRRTMAQSPTWSNNAAFKVCTSIKENI